MLVLGALLLRSWNPSHVFLVPPAPSCQDQRHGAIIHQAEIIMIEILSITFIQQWANIISYLVAPSIFRVFIYWIPNYWVLELTHRYQLVVHCLFTEIVILSATTHVCAVACML